MTPEQEQQLRELTDFKRNMERSSTIPLAIDQAFRERFANIAIDEITSSSKSASSENQSVNEAGVATYSVLNPPDAFLKVTVGTTTYNIPVYL